jgi:hypothetical protein
MTILKGAELNEHQYFRAAVLGWCVELVSIIALIHHPSYSRFLCISLRSRRLF